MPTTVPAPDAYTLAADWRARLAQTTATPLRVQIAQADLPRVTDSLAEFVAATLVAGQSLLIVVPDDECLPELSNALDLALRPLCLVLPGPGFAAEITLRATLSLLNSRLARGDEGSFSAVWDSQRRRLTQAAELWHAALAWSPSSSGRTQRPAQIGELFPVCILHAAQTEFLSATKRDILLVLQAQRLSERLPQIIACASCALLLQDPLPGGGLVMLDEDARLKAELEILAQELGDMELEFATLQAELAEFSREYHARIGSRMIELDALQARIARCYADRLATDELAQDQAQQAEAKADQSRKEYRRFTELDRETEKPFAPSTDLKRLFRQLAQKIHPDRASDETDRAWRSELMSEANRAYRAGDEMVLLEILNQWQTGRPEQARSRAETIAPPGPARQIARMQKRLAEIEAELNHLIASRLYELFAAANLARQNDRDLLQELVEQLDAQIAAARARLEELEAN